MTMAMIGELDESWDEVMKDSQPLYRSGYIDGATEFRDAAIEAFKKHKHGIFHVHEIIALLKNLKANENGE